MRGFFPKVDEKYGNGDREYNWWVALNPLVPKTFMEG